MIFLLILVTLFYCLIVGSLIFGWKKVEETHLEEIQPEIKFSIVVPYRNEAENLPVLLNSFSQLNYPKDFFEILLVNDGSRDQSEKICQQFRQEQPNLKINLLTNLNRTGSPKKDAITTAIETSQFEYILTTDADCTVRHNWLLAFNQKILETGAKLVAGPVKLMAPVENVKRKTRSFLNFQELDFMSLQASGAGGFGVDKPFMCNGANLCYQKDAFVEAKGFLGNQEIAGGDDVFLLQKFSEKKFPVAFLKDAEATVETKPQPDLNALISQRIRWAAKTPAYKTLFAKILGATVLAMNFCLLLAACMAFFSLLPYQYFLLMFLLKFNMDFTLIYQAAKFFERQEILRSYFWSSLLYPIFSVYIAILSLFKGYEWKGRTFRR